MGTRNLTIVIKDGKHRVAQYGQWDGYPTGQGETVVKFIMGLNGELDDFKSKVEGCSFLTNEELDQIGEKHKNWPEIYPWFSRNCGAKVLDYIARESRGLRDQYDFAAESLHCEWAYVINLDNEELEIYEGFNKKPLTNGERFYQLKPKDNGYFQVKLLRKYHFSKLSEGTMKALEEELNKEES